jgi:hypothetical protein
MTVVNKINVEFFEEWSQYNWSSDKYKYYKEFKWEDDWAGSWKWEQPMIGHCCGAALKPETKENSRPVVRRGITILAGHLGKQGVYTTSLKAKWVGPRIKYQVDHVKCKAGDLTCVIALEDTNV